MSRSRMPWVAALIAGAGTIVAPAAYAAKSPRQASEARQVDAIKLDYDRFVLPNGLTVLVYTDHSVPTIYVGVRYRTGSRDEPSGKSGFAHLFEHLMFQPTPHRPGEFFTSLQRAGATNMNGSTDLDYTNYFETIPSNALGLALWLESDRMGYLGQGITQALLDEQRGVVKNEKRQGELQPGAGLQARFQADFYPAGHPYAHTTIGSMDDLDRASLDDVKTWFRDHYGASNAVLVLAGDVDAKTARAEVTRYFGGVRAGTPISRSLQWVPDLGQIRREAVYDRFAAASLSRTWPIPNDDPRASTLMLLLARALAGSKDTPLERALVGPGHVATEVTAQFSENLLASTFAISMVLAPGVSPQAANRALDAALGQYMADGPDPERLRTIGDATDIATLQALQSNAMIGDFLVSGETDHDDPAFFLKQRKWIGEAGPTELKSLAAKWLQRPYYELQLLPTPGTPVDSSDIDRTHVPEPGPFNGAIIFPPVTEMRLANGMKLVVAERHRASIANMSLQLATGALADHGDARGTAAAAFDLLLAGSRQFNAAALQRQSSRLGARITGTAGDRLSAVTWTSSVGRLDQTFALAANVLRHPTYPQAAVDTLARATAAQSDAYDRDPMGDAGAIFARAIWGATHPAGRIPTRGAGPAISRDAIVRFHDHQIGPDNATLYVVGDVTPAAAKRLADTYFGAWTPIAPPPTPEALPPAAPQQARIILVDAPGAVQSGISVGNLTLPFDANRSAGEALVDAALGGDFESRVNANLRGKGWSYGFTGGIEDRPAGPRMFVLSGSVQTDKTAQSMAELRREISEFVSTSPITADELEAVRSAGIHAVPLGFTGNGAFLNSMVTSSAYGLPYDSMASATRRMAAVTLDDARRIALEIYRPDTLTWLVVGDLRLIEPGIRALNLAPIEVWDIHGRKLR